MVTGDLVIDDSFTATPNGFIAATPPTVTAAYSRAGNTVEILIKVTPTASTTTDANTTITIPTFGGIRLDSVGTVVSQNNTSRGNCFVSANGVIQMPVILSGTTSPLYIRATLITIHTPS